MFNVQSFWCGLKFKTGSLGGYVCNSVLGVCYPDMSLSRTGEDITYLRLFNVAGEVNFSAFIYKHKWSNGLDMRLPEH